MSQPPLVATGEAVATDAAATGGHSSETAADAARLREHAGRQIALGVTMGLLSAAAYTATNIALRGVTRGGDPDWAIWVTCLKSVPSATAAWLLIGLRLYRGQPTWPAGRVIAWLAVLGLFTSAGANVLFQWSLGLCGLALAVPTVFATIILTGAVLGLRWLGEALTPRTLLAMGLLVAAILVLSLGAKAAASVPAASEMSRSPEVAPVVPAPLLTGTAAVLTGIGFAAVAGTLYGLLGVVIRQVTTAAVPLPVTLAVVSSVGVVGLGLTAGLRMSTAELGGSAREYALLLAAGLLNAIAFFAIGGALRRIPVVQVNLINASQAALCALAGVLIYHEPLTTALAAGTALTVLGLVLVERGPRR